MSASARAGDISSVEFLFARGYKLDSEGGLFWDSPLIAAIHGNQPKMVRYLISKGVGVNPPPTELTGTPLMVAVEEGSLEIAKILVQEGANICTKNQTGETAIDIA
jgi:ankyrin repeat protein